MEQEPIPKDGAVEAVSHWPFPTDWPARTDVHKDGAVEALSPPPAQLWIEEIAERVAQEVAREDRQRDGEPGEHHHPPRRPERFGQHAAQHVPPARRRGRDADSEEAEGGF